MYTIYMVCRSTVCNQSEILPVGASWPGDFVAVSILFLAPSQVVISIQHMWYLLLVIYILPINNTHRHVSRGYLQILQNETSHIYF